MGKNWAAISRRLEDGKYSVYFGPGLLQTPSPRQCGYVGESEAWLASQHENGNMIRGEAALIYVTFSDRSRTGGSNLQKKELSATAHTSVREEAGRYQREDRARERAQS